MLHQVKFLAHEDVLANDKLVLREAPKLGICKFVFIAYRDYDIYDDRGW